MALINSLESDGNWLFRRRGQLPVVLFLLAVPAIAFTDYEQLSPAFSHWMNWLAAGCSLLGFLVRAYTIGTTPRGTSGRNTAGQVAESLNSTGIYSLVRHPLYLGNYLMWIGIVIFTKNIWFVIIVSLLYWLYYERIMFAEERFLERKFGDAYLKWASKLPAFVPRLSGFVPSVIPFSVRSVLRREYSGVLATVIGFVFVEVMIGWFRWGTFSIGDHFLVVLYVTIAMTLLLRSLKHYTSLLNEEGRS